jgi:hypothetical protein
MAPYWEGLRWVAYMGVGTGVWKYVSLPMFRMVAVFSHNPTRRQHALEVLRLARPDASTIPSYLTGAEAETAKTIARVTARPSREDQPTMQGIVDVAGVTSVVPDCGTRD